MSTQSKAAIILAGEYVKFLKQDNGIVSKSHIVMHNHTVRFSAAQQTVYHTEISRIFSVIGD